MVNTNWSIGIDIDDTFFECLPVWLHDIHTVTGISYSRMANMLDGGFFTFYKEIEEQTGYDAFGWWADDQLYCHDRIKPKPYAVDVIKSWIDDPRIDVTFITSSINSHIDSKDRAVERHLNRKLGDKFDIIHSSAKHEYAFDVFIDDAEHNVTKFAEYHPNARILCLRTPINRTFLESNQNVAVDDWCQIADIVGFDIYGENSNG